MKPQAMKLNQAMTDFGRDNALSLPAFLTRLFGVVAAIVAVQYAVGYLLIAKFGPVETFGLPTVNPHFWSYTIGLTAICVPLALVIFIGSFIDRKIRRPGHR